MNRKHIVGINLIGGMIYTGMWRASCTCGHFNLYDTPLAAQQAAMRHWKRSIL